MTHPGPNLVALSLAEVLQLIGQHERTAERLSELTHAVNAYLDAYDACVKARATADASTILDTGFDRANTLRALRELVDDK